MSKNKFPLYGWIGIILVLLFWYLNWSLDALRTHWGFFFLWLGYSLSVDALVYFKKQTSLLTRNLKQYILLFLISMPCWWLFELFNYFTQNWFYDGRQYFSDPEYFLFASLSFSTVMPAVFGTAELTCTFSRIKNLTNRRKFSPLKNAYLIFLLSGITIALLILIFPKIFYPFIWISVFFIIEPINNKLGYRTIFDSTAAGNWSLAASLAAAGIICGFFWELWNFYSYPKWIYSLPGVNVLHVFEMPLPGYLGYLSFPFELYALYNFISGLMKIKHAELYTFI